MSIMNLKVRHNAQVKTIALYNGLASEELRSILQAVFLLGTTSVVVGFLSPEVRDYYPLKQKLIYIARRSLKLVFVCRCTMLYHDSERLMLLTAYLIHAVSTEWIGYSNLSGVSSA